MGITRTQTVEPGTEFEAHAQITKSWVDTRTGRRHIGGVATGVAEDRDGERVSKNAISGMGRKIAAGGVKVTSSHQQDWMTEIGDVCKYEYDADTDEMIVEGALPPEGEDPIADKAWKTANKPGSKLAWSIGGKLLSSFFERNEVGKKRKVLDSIDLRHIMLTENPAYQRSFATAVAKTWDGETPDDDAFTIDAEVEKTTTGSWASGSSDSGGGNVGRDSVGSGPRNAGERKPGTKGPSVDDDGSNEDDEKPDQDLPKAKDERHLACPNCGHEFAADLPVDADMQADTTDQTANAKEDEDRDTGKSVETSQMSTKLSESLDALKALAATDAVAKTDPEPTADDVTKTVTGDGELSDIEKAIAAGYRAHEDRFERVETGLAEAFDLVAKALQGVREDIKNLPLGRKSIARVHPSGEGISKTSGDGTAVEKTVDEQIDEAPSAAAALKLMNEAAGWTKNGQPAR